MNTEPPKDAPEHRITLKTWCDIKRDIWRAELIYTEYRNGKQYGGAEHRYITAKPNTTYRQFMARLRKTAQKDLNTYWT